MSSSPRLVSDPQASCARLTRGPQQPALARINSDLLGSAGSGRHPFPCVIATTRSSDSPDPSAFALVPLAQAYHGGNACSWPRRSRIPLRRRVGVLVTGSPFHRILSVGNRGLPGCWVVLFLRAAVKHPAGSAAVSPLPATTTMLSSTIWKPWTPEINPLSRLYTCGPHVRCPTHQRPCCQFRCKDSLPACRAQLWPDGFRTRWTTYRFSRTHRHLLSHRTSLAWPLPQSEIRHPKSKHESADYADGRR